MREFRFTVCRYYSNLLRPESAYDFAVVVASRRAIVLCGVNVSAYGIFSENIIAQNMVENTTDALSNRLGNILHENNPSTGYDAIAQLIGGSLSNFQFSPIEHAKTELPIQAFALQLLTSTVLNRLPADEPEWAESSGEGQEKWVDEPAISPAFRMTHLEPVG